MEISLPYVYFLAVALSAFAVWGYLRGWAREAFTLAGSVTAWMLTITEGKTVLDFVNKLYRAALFLVQGGIEVQDPGALARRLGGVQLMDLQHDEVPLSVFYGILVIVTYLLVDRYVERKTTIAGHVVGSCLGTLNGYVSTNTLLHWPSQNAVLVTTLTVPDENTIVTFGQYIPAGLVVGVGLVVILALINSMRSNRRGTRSEWAGRK
ncbi:MAG: hypothetical protein HY675_18390 [Chloroflexi bacterium]|nr:hypothetical protein [Chloroflexota bacterium]